MKIVHIITRLIVGGAQENTLLSCEGQHDAGHDVTLLTGPSLGPEGTLMQRASQHGYRVETIDAMRRSILPWQDLTTYSVLTKRLRELKPDVVHTHSSKAGIIGRYAAHAAGVPRIVHTIHGLSWTASKHAAVNAFYRHLERRTARLSHKIVCVADAMAKQSLAHHIGTPEQYVTVHSGMDIAPFLNPPVPREVVRAQLGLGDSHIAVGTIARLFHMKGHDDLLDLAPMLCAAHPRLRFVWIGDGLLRQQFEQRIATMDLKDRFILTGLVPPTRIPELVNALDIVAHPSRREGLARAIPQGQLARCPVVCYDIDGNAEGLVHDQTGYAIAPFDVPKFGEALDRLLKDDTLRSTFGEKGREHASKLFDTRVMVRKLDEVYRSIHPSPSPGV
ncbi:MAG: glycosyltransferase family 4 protein [Tepidisphaeraceae bacterium]